MTKCLALVDRVEGRWREWPHDYRRAEGRHGEGAIWVHADELQVAIK